MESFPLVSIALDILAIALMILVWVLNARNVRALKKTRNALRESQEKLGFTLCSAGVGVWSWDVVTDSITVDQTCSVLFGFAPGEFARNLEGFTRLIHPEDLPQVQQAIAAAIESGAEYKIEFRVVWPDGTIRVVANRAKVYRDAAGNPAHLAGITLDVTEQKGAADELRSANERLARSLAEVGRHSQENALLAEMTDLLQSCSSSTEAYDLVAQFCMQLFPQRAGALFIFSASRNLVQAVARWNDPALAALEFGPNECWALRRGHAHFVDTGRVATPCPHLKGVARAGHACVPLIGQGTGLGVLYFQSLDGSPESQVIGEPERELCSTVARQVALSLANLSLQDALRGQTIRDPLTGLFNRRYLEDSLERELHRMARRQQPVGFAMIDIDHFKAVNDTYGHDAGDAVLRAFGQFLKERMRKEDIACRYGGEEFCAVFAESSLENTVRRCEQLRADVKQMMVQHGAAHLPPISISIGVACHPVHGNESDALIAVADCALYEAKAAGRDRVVVAQAAATGPTKAA